jgi:DNA-binding CsgD family transcriptional regulator/tetratricopeptide (TPR) repeat protein
MDLLERAPLLDELERRLAATAGGGRVVLLAGEAGIGKTSLVRQFAERQAGGTLQALRAPRGPDGKPRPALGARFLLGACDPLLTPRALGPLHDIGRQTGGRLATLLAGGAPREQLFAALLDELDPRAGPGGPQVVVVEDAHWADEATLDLLVFLGRRMERTAALLVVTYRDDELGDGHPLRAVLGVLPGELVARLRPEPLSEAAVAELAARAGRPATGLRALTGGNPLLLTETLAAGDAGVSMTVRDLVLARLAGLPDDGQEVVRLVSVVPGRAEVWLLEAALPTVEAGVSAGLLVTDGRTVGFRHELLRRAVEDSLPALRRRELNRRVLAVLTEAGREVDVARLVHHAREAGDVEAVLRHGPEAARQAAAVAAHREAVGHYRAVLPHLGRLDPAARAELLEAHSVECYLAGLSAEAVSARRSALELREAAGDREQLGEGLRWLSRLHWWDGNRKEAEAAAARAIAVLEPLEPGHRLAMAYSNQAQLDMLAYRIRPALDWAARAIELSRRLGDQETLSHALTNIGSARMNSGDPAGRAELEQGFEVAVAAGLEDHAARALSNLATLAVEIGDFGHAAADLDRALAFVRSHELAGYVQHLLGNRARLRLAVGDWAGAERDAHDALAERVHASGRLADALVPLALLQARRGEPGAAATLQEATEQAFATGELQWTGQAAAARAEYAWLQGDDDRAAEEAALVFDEAADAGHRWFAGELAFWMRLGGAPVRVEIEVTEPWRLLLDGDWRAAAHAWRDLGCPYYQALALARGDRDDALLEAVALLDGLGARQTAQQVRRFLRQRGARRIPRGPIRATAANPAGLTGRQVEVLRLLTEGLTDAGIAARLSLSPKTVGHHVSALLAKLGVGSRRDAAAAARRLGIGTAKDGEPGGQR